MAKRSKKYKSALEKLQAKDFYTLVEAMELVKQTTTTNFVSSVEIHLNLGIDTKHADQQVRSTVVLPHGTGKEVRVLAFVDEANVEKAKAAGANEAGSEEIIEKIQKGWLDFDVAVATPDQMKKIGKIAKTLGQRGLMPNPKAGTVTPDIEKAIEEIKKGKVEFRNDKQGNLHNLLGNVGFDSAQLIENAKVYLKAVTDNKPSGAKGTFVKSITLTTTMGPAIKLEVSQTLDEL